MPPPATWSNKGLPDGQRGRRQAHGVWPSGSTTWFLHFNLSVSAHLLLVYSPGSPGNLSLTRGTGSHPVDILRVRSCQAKLTTGPQDAEPVDGSTTASCE
jgi:hypothetical protein